MQLPRAAHYASHRPRRLIGFNAGLKELHRQLSEGQYAIIRRFMVSP